MVTQKTVQAYRQAPWRSQLQIIGLFSLALVMVALIAGIYLNVTSRAATIGRRIQFMQDEIQKSRQVNADLETQLALITSTSQMERRAESLGFRPAIADQFLYLAVEGYPGRRPVVLAPPPGPLAADAPVLPAEFTQSLIDWLRQVALYPPLRWQEVIR